MFNWFKKKSKDEEVLELKEEKIDLDKDETREEQAVEETEAKQGIESSGEAQVEEKPEVKEEKSSFFKRMFSGLEKTRQNLN